MGGLAAAWFGFQFGFSAALLAGAATFARPWFTELNLAWITLTDDETTAAIVHSVGAIVVLVVTTVAIDRSFSMIHRHRPI